MATIRDVRLALVAQSMFCLEKKQKYTYDNHLTLEPLNFAILKKIINTLLVCF